MHMYKITADYIPYNPNKPTYYILAENAKAAKKSFSNTYIWLKVYGVEDVPVEEAREIWAEHKYICVNYIACSCAEEIE